MSAAVPLSVRGLTAGYDDGSAVARGGVLPVPVLADVEFELEPGECLAVVGRSGCGKSTLLHVLAGLLPPTGGAVVVAGQTVAAADWAASGSPGCRSGHAAYMFQQDLLLPWKRVLENTVFAARVAPEPDADDLEDRATRMLREFGLGASLGALPRELSGGMRQRVALARTLMLSRGLVLLDEPFGSLDAMTRAEMRRWLLDVMAAHPATWVLVTHDVDEAVLLGDRVAVMCGRPARLEGWTDVPLSREERRGIAAADAGDSPGASSRGMTTNSGLLEASGEAARMAALSADVRGLLRSESAIQ